MDGHLRSERLRLRQQEIAEQRALEDTPRVWDDWRDPETLEI